MALTPSQRVVLIKEVAARLAAEEWPLVDVTLKQFGLPWSDQWSDSKEAYVLKMIGDARDDVLVDLAHHVGFTLRSAGARNDPPFWRKDMFRVFVSHLAAHRTFAAELQAALLEYGISSFVAHNDIEPTAEWQAQIELALSSCDGLVALLHPNFHQSNWTDQEIGYAMGRGVPAFSIRFGPDPYGFIGRFQAFNGNGKTSAEIARELFDAYRKNEQTQYRMANVLVQLLEDSPSFAAAKTRMGYLEELNVWESSLSTRLLAAATGRPQVEGAWGVPARIEALVKKWEASP